MEIATFASFDGARLSYRTLGAGRPVLLLHGFLANAELNWMAPGIGAALADAGFLAIAPDMRGHGASIVENDPARFPQDVLANDVLALIAHLGLSVFDLVGYSMGARAAVRMLVRGATPRRCVLGGMGDAGVTSPERRIAYFERLLGPVSESADPKAAARVAQLLAWTGGDRAQVLRALATQPATTPEELSRLTTPILVLCGADDSDNGSAEALAAMLSNARAERTPGDHATAVMAPEFAAAILAFLR